MINYKKERPDDYHCNCEYCKNLFRGELRKEDGSYYSARDRRGYSEYEKENKHICKGHWQGYKFIIENYTDVGDVVFDPFAGSGTTLVEAKKLDRYGIGNELEFYDILEKNVENKNGINIFEGDIRKNIDLINVDPVDLIVTGPPYNHNADPPERKNLKGEDKSFNYDKELDNMAWLKDEKYYSEFKKLFKKLIDKLKDGGHFVLIIKDTVRNKEAYLLHYHLGKLLDDLGLIPKDVWIHYHWPPTLFMNTYPKKYPDVKIPKYQTMLVFEKKQ